MKKAWKKLFYPLLFSQHELTSSGSIKRLQPKGDDNEQEWKINALHLNESN